MGRVKDENYGNNDVFRNHYLRHFHLNSIFRSFLRRLVLLQQRAFYPAPSSKPYNLKVIKYKITETDANNNYDWMLLT